MRVYKGWFELRKDGLRQYFNITVGYVINYFFDTSLS